MRRKRRGSRSSLRGLIRMFDFGSILENLKNKRFSPFLQKIYRQMFKFYPHEGVKVIDEDWDVLVVLDACRYDVFEEVNYLDGELSYRTSKASNSFEWLQKNFPGYYEDIVHISSNPYATPSDDGGFRSDEHFEHMHSLVLDEDIQEHNVVLPEELTDRALSIMEKNGDKRVILHYMQPHIPYIGEVEHPESTVAETAYEEGDEFLKEAYKSNLLRALESVERLVENLSGKIVVTADHGEMLGEYGMYGHYPEVYFEGLVKVPWLELQGRGDLEVNSDTLLSEVDY